MAIKLLSKTEAAAQVFTRHGCGFKEGTVGCKSIRLRYDQGGTEYSKSVLADLARPSGPLFIETEVKPRARHAFCDKRPANVKATEANKEESMSGAVRSVDAYPE